MLKYLYLALVIVFYMPSNAQAVDKGHLKDGDLIFQDMDCGPLCDAIEAVTNGYNGNDFSHMGMVYHKNDSIYIIEAAGTAVRLTPLDKFSQNTYKPMFVGRLKKKYNSLIKKAIAFSVKQVGIPYDDEYIHNNGKYYCSELIYDAFKAANNNKPFFELLPMTYKQPETDTFFPVWVTYYKDLGREIPEGEPGCNPGGISLSDKIDIIGTLK